MIVNPAQHPSVPPSRSDPRAALPSSPSEARRRLAEGLVSLDPAVAELGRRFARAGHELALVGGSVRDLVLGREAPDLDFTTDARPDDTLAILVPWADAHWEVGRRFGTIAASRGGVKVEVTTYRTDQYHADSRKPEVEFGDTLEGDLVRRDFTVNAMAVRLPAMDFVDPTGGLDDLILGRLRTPAAPEQSFSDDPLRMMRAARFVAQLGLEVDDEACQAMAGMAERIGIVSAERVHDELVKLLAGADPVAGLRLLVDTGLAERVLPELPALRLERDEHLRHKDVYEHSLTVLRQVMDLEDSGPDVVLRLAAVLHDCGKPATRRFDAAGAVSFHHHEVVGAKLAGRRMRALHFDKDSIRVVGRLIALHMRFFGYSDQAWTDSAVRRYVTEAGDELARLNKLVRADVTTRNRRKAARLDRAMDDLEERIARLAQEEELAAIRPDLNGEQIMALLGLRPGPVVGRAYRFLLSVRLDEGPLTEAEAEARLRAWWAEQPEAGTAD